MSYSVREVINCLSIREFTALTNLVDEFGPKSSTKAVLSDGSGRSNIFHEVAGELRQRKFGIERVVRGSDKIQVLVCFAHGVTQLCEIPAEEPKIKAA